ncbi:MAG: TldD/PmbA family protein [Chloroflexota bacterium]
MIGKDQVQALARLALEHSRADQTEVVLLGEDSGLTRFANSYIHQNVAESNLEVRVRVVFGKCIGVASTNDLSADAIRRAVDEASRIAKLQPENPDFVSLPGLLPGIPANAYAKSTAEATPERRAEVARIVCQQALASGLNAAGAFSTAAYEMAVHNSLGVAEYALTTGADFNTVVMGEDSSGYAAQAAMDIDEIDGLRLADEAVGLALRSRGPSSLEPGQYEVVLDAHAVQDIVEFCAYLGFSARSLAEGTSFLTGKLGQKVLGANIHLWDDGHDPAGLPMPFDYEGVPKQRVNIVENGVAKAVVYDSYAAHKEGKQSTGHALPAPNSYGPLPLNMFMAAGDASVEDMVRSTKRGLLVTRFHYTEPVHPLLVVVTGMTRDGTFLIEDGRIVRPVRNLRFTQSYLEALSHVEAISKETRLVKGFLGGYRVPALKVSQFNFTGVTEF